MSRPFIVKFHAAILLATCIVWAGCASNTSSSSQSNANTAGLPPVVATA